MWRRILRGLGFFCAFSVTVVGMFVLSGVVMRGLQRHQEQRAERAHYAVLGLRSMCSTEVERGCVKRAAKLANVAVASMPSSYGQLVVSVGPPEAGAVAQLTATPTKRMVGHYRAVEYIVLSFDKSSFHGDLYTAPKRRPGYAYRRRGAIDIDGVRVEVRSAPWPLCSGTVQRAKRPGCAKDVWAEWSHDGQLYAANYTESSLSRSPAETLRSLFREITYTEPF